MPISGRGLDSGESDGAIERHDIYEVEDSFNYWSFEDDDYNEGLMTYDLEVVRNQYRNDDEFKFGVWILNKKRGMRICNEERPPSRSELFEKLKQLDWKLDLALCADLVFVLSRDELNEFTIKSYGERTYDLIIPSHVCGRKSALKARYNLCMFCGRVSVRDPTIRRHSPMDCFKIFTSVLLYYDLRDNCGLEEPSRSPPIEHVFKSLAWPHATIFKPIKGTILHQISLFSLRRVDYILTCFYRCQLCQKISRIPYIAGLSSECSLGCDLRRRKIEPLPFMSQLPKPSVLDEPALLTVVSEATVDAIQKFWNDPNLAKTEMENLIEELKELEDEIADKTNREQFGWVYCHFSQNVLAMDSGMMRAFTAKYVGNSITTTRPCHHFWLSRQNIGPHARFITEEFTQSRVIFWSRVRLPRIAMHLAESAISDLLRPLLSNHNSPKGTAPGCTKEEVDKNKNALPPEWMQTGSEKRQKLAASLLCVLTRRITPGKVAQSEVVVSDGVSETIQLCGWVDAFR